MSSALLTIGWGSSTGQLACIYKQYCCRLNFRVLKFVFNYYKFLFYLAFFYFVEDLPRVGMELNESLNQPIRLSEHRSE